MSNIFGSLKTIYGQPWTVKSVRKFNDEEKATVLSASVVSSQYGNSVCFVMKAGGVGYIPCSNDSSLPVGSPVDLDKAEIVTLGRQGEADIERIKC